MGKGDCVIKKIISVLILLSLLGVLTGCGLTVPRPEIKSGEFEFSVTYEWNGETKTISGVYVCEYNGTDWALDGGYHREWKGYIKGGESQEMIEIGTTADSGKVNLNLAFYPEYFMNDPLTGGKEAPIPWLSVTHVDGEGMSIQNEAEIIEETYGAKIVSYEYDAPITNEFGIFNLK